MGADVGAKVVAFTGSKCGRASPGPTRLQRGVLQVGGGQLPQTPVTVHPPMAERGQLTEDARSQPASQERKAEFVLSEGSL